MYQALAIKCGYSPMTIREMTFEQQLNILEIGDTITFRDQKEYTEWLRDKKY